jgi:hypothetical protein
MRCSSDFSASVPGRSEAKRSGRQGAGRPHISVVGSALWDSPMAGPMRDDVASNVRQGQWVRAVIFDGNHRLVQTGRRAVNERNSRSESTTTMLPSILLRLSGSPRGLVTKGNIFSRSSTGIAPTTCVKVPPKWRAEFGQRVVPESNRIVDKRQAWIACGDTTVTVGAKSQAIGGASSINSTAKARSCGGTLRSSAWRC